MDLVSFYFQIYVHLLLFYFWYRFLFRFAYDVFDKKDYPVYKAKASVIIPVYNEKDYLLEMCVKSVVEANGDNEILVVNDCSKNRNLETIKSLKKKYPQIIAINLTRNKGKRKAQFDALKFVSGDIIVTLDSDSVLDKNSLVELLKPFNDERIGATTGNVRVLNRDINFLTKMVDARYRNAFSFERAGLSSFGLVTCCSGVISAYRRSIIEQVKDDYINQLFLGRECTYGDDRYLTNLFLKRGYKIKYVATAIARTEVPYTYGGFIKQQLRWKKSFIRESLITFSYAFKINKILALENSLNFVLPFISLFSRLVIIYGVIFYPIMLIPVIISVVIISIMRNLLLFFEEGRIALYAIPYAFVHEFVLYWLYWYALFTLKENHWGTR